MQGLSASEPIAPARAIRHRLVAAFTGDLRRLAVDPLFLALPALAAAAAAGIATSMFAAIGARRIRTLAQIVATVLATGIGVGAQVARQPPDHMQESIAATSERCSQSAAFAGARTGALGVRGERGRGEDFGGGAGVLI